MYNLRARAFRSGRGNMENAERRVKVFCITCSFAPDDLFFPVIVTAAIKGTW